MTTHLGVAVPLAAADPPVAIPGHQVAQVAQVARLVLLVQPVAPQAVAGPVTRAEILACTRATVPMAQL